MKEMGLKGEKIEKWCWYDVSQISRWLLVLGSNLSSVRCDEI